jgi:hypothetical protein
VLQIIENDHRTVLSVNTTSKIIGLVPGQVSGCIIGFVEPGKVFVEADVTHT